VDARLQHGKGAERREYEHVQLLTEYPIDWLCAYQQMLADTRRDEAAIHGRNGCV
jgi:hypothetical protein